VLGDIVGLPFLAAQFIQMIREDETDAAGVDAELDAVEAAAAVAARADPADPGPAAGEPAGNQPWWENDPRFADRFRRAGDP
jgi:putative copper resistance protein D